MSIMYKKEFGGYKFNIEQFNSPSEVAKVNATRSYTDQNFDNMEDGRVGRDKRFYGVDSYEQALEYLDKGYQPNVDKLDNFEAGLRGIAKRVQFENSVAGFAPVVPLAIMGVPNCMINTRVKPIKAKVLDVYYVMNVSCSINAEQLLKAGEQLLNAILQLEMQGYKFNLYVMQAYRGGKERDVLLVKVKGSNEPLNIKRMSFALCHPGFYRVIGFDWYGKVPGGTFYPGYGVPLFNTITQEEGDRLFKGMFGDTAVVFAAANIIGEDSDYLKNHIVGNDNEVA